MDWREILDQHGSALVLYARQWSRSHADAEDAVQEGFVRVWKSGALKRVPPDKIVPYLFTAVKTAALDRIRSAKRRKTREEKASEDLYEPGEMFELDPDAEDRQRVVQEAVSRLPEAQREVMVMKIWGELTFKEIGEALKISQNTAASRYRYGMERLRGLLEAEPVAREGGLL